MSTDRPESRGTPREPLPRAEREETASEAVGRHPIGAGVGAMGGIAAGAAIGAVGGPAGSLAGAVIGGLAGGAAGGEIAEGTERRTAPVDKDAEDRYWRENFRSRAYVGDDANFGDYGPAYYYGVEMYSQYDGDRPWEEAESDMEKGWDSVRGSSRLAWDDAKHAVRDAWTRLKDMF